MSNKTKSIYFAAFGVLYFGYTAVIVKHGIHWTNSLITIAVLILSGYYYLKNRKG